MVDIVTRLGKGSPLTNAEVDANFTNLAEVSGVTGEPMGHEDRTTSTISFNASTRTFTIAPTASSFTVWCKGKKVVVSSAQTVTIPNTTGMYSIYFDSTGTLAAKSGYFTFSDEAPTAYIYWNATTGTAPYFGDERHGVVLDWQTHEYLHRTRGAALASGFSASGYALGGSGSLNSHAQLTLEGGTFFDEDMKIIVTATNTPTAGTWEQDLLSPARIPVLYLSGTAWVIDAPTDYPLKQGTARPQYNAFSGGVWSTADVANNKYATSWILATNNLTYPVIAIIGQAESDLQSAAEAVDFTELQLPGFPSVEFRPLYKLIFQCADSCTNAVHASLVSITDIRSIAAAGTAASIVTDHGNLSGLSDDDHPQYLSVDTVRGSLTAAVKASFLPSQTSNDGKFLQTNGTATSWAVLSSANVTTALGFTPYNATNPTGYVTAAGARGAISVTGAGSYDSNTGVINIVGGVTSFNTRTGAITLQSGDVTTALGYTPLSNATSYLPLTGGTLSGKLTLDGRNEIYGVPTNAGTIAGFMGGTSGGTTAARTQSLNTQTLLNVAAIGYTGSAWVGGAGLSFVATENITAANRGTKAVLTAIAAGDSVATTMEFNGSALTINGSTAVTSSNYNTYAPTKTGTGASGTWAINITGNAATATSATDSTKLPLAGGTLTGSLIINTGTSAADYNDVWIGGASGWSTNESHGINTYYSATPATTAIFTRIDSLYNGTVAVMRWKNFYYGAAQTSTVMTLTATSATTAALNVTGAITQASNQVLHAGNYTSYSPTLTGGSASGTWGISITGNAATATSLATARTISLTSDVTGSASFNGSADVSITATVADDSHNHTNFTVFGGVSNLNSISGVGETKFRPFISDFQATNRSGSNYNAGFDIGAAATGFRSQFVFEANTAATGPKFRNLVDGSWGSWYELLHSANYNSYSPTLTGGGASGTWGISITGNAGTATKVTRKEVAGYLWNGSSMSYLWTKIGRVSGASAMIVSILASTDSNYSGMTAAIATFKSYDNISASMQLDAVTANSCNVQIAVDNSGDCWIYAQAEWSSFVRYNIEEQYNCTIYSSPTQQTTAPANSKIISPGQGVRATYGNVTGASVYNTGSIVGDLTVRGTASIGGNTALHAGNYSSYALPLSGGTATNVTLGVRANNSVFGGNTSGMSAHSFTAEIRANGAKPTLTWHYEDVATRHIALDADGALNLYNPNESGGAVFKVGGNTALHAGNYTNYTLPLGGSWYGSGLPGTRWNGLAVSGGEIVFGNGLPNANQMGILVDGCYVAGENNGFWSMGSDNTWGSRRGMYWDGTYLNFTQADPVGLFRNFQVGTATAYDNPGGWSATSIVTGTYHARVRVRGTSYNSSGDNEVYLWVDNTVTPRSGIYSSTAFNISPAGGLYESGNRVLNASNYSSYALPLTGGTLSGALTVTGGSSSIIAQDNGGSGDWRGRIISRNSTYDRAAFLGVYNGITGVFAHNHALNAWADLYVNTSDGSGGGTVRMPSSVLISGNQALHGGNYRSFDGTLRALGGNDGMNFNTLTYNSMYYAYIENSANKPGSYSYSYGTVLTFDPGQGAGGRAQIYISHAGNDLIFRGGWGGNDSWQTWNKVLTNQNYTSYSPSLGGYGASGTWGISVTGNAGTASSTTYLAALGSYVWSASTNGRSFNSGIQTSFVQASNGYQSYGSVVRIATYPNDGATAELYFPYSSTYGGSAMQYRLGQYDNAGWTGWKTVLDNSNYSSYALPLSGGTLSGTLTANAGIYSPKIGISSSNLADTVNGAPWYGLGATDLTFGAAMVPQFAGYYGLRIRTASTVMDFAPNGDPGNINVLNGGFKVGGNTVLHAGNYSSYAVPLSGGTMSGRLTISPGWTTSGRNYSNEWIEFGNYSGLYSPQNGAHFYPNNGTYGAWRSAGSRNGWSGIEFDASSGNVVLMISSNSTGFHNNNYGWQLRWSDGVAYVGKSSYGGGTDAVVLDSSNYGSYALPRSGGTLTGGLVIGSGGTSQLQINSPSGSQALWIRTGYTANGTATPATSLYNVQFQSSGSSGGTFTFCTGNDVTLSITGGAVNSSVALQQSGNQVLHAGNVSSYALPIGGGTTTGIVNITGNGNTGSNNNVGLNVYSTGGNGANMAFHRSNYYAINMGLDSDNVFRIGGWSASANLFQMNMSGNLTMAGNVTAYSDERLKKDWALLPSNFIEALAQVKSGTYTRIDSDERQVGVSAQGLQEFLAEAVQTDNDGMLSVNYGGAALASAVELAKRVVDQEKRIAHLESLINKLIGD